MVNQTVGTVQWSGLGQPAVEEPLSQRQPPHTGGVGTAEMLSRAPKLFATCGAKIAFMGEEASDEVRRRQGWMPKGTDVAGPCGNGTNGGAQRRAAGLEPCGRGGV